MEEILNSYEFKTIKKSLLRQFPFITDVIIDKNDFEKYPSVLFINILVDYELFEKTTGIILFGFIKEVTLREGEYHSLYLSSCVRSEFKYQAEGIESDIKNDVSDIHNSKSFFDSTQRINRHISLHGMIFIPPTSQSQS